MRLNLPGYVAKLLVLLKPHKIVKLVKNKHNIPEEWIMSYSSYPRMATVPQLFAEQAKDTPDAIAVSDNLEQLTFADLDRRSDRLAWALLDAGILPESAVAIVMRRSVRMIVAMLAVLKVGGTYVPVDENCPAQRLLLILEDAGIKFALTDEANTHRLQKMPVLVVSETVTSTDPPDRAKGPFPTPSHSGPLSRAYIMYTSGSTGTPKGVEVVHRGIVRLVRNTNYVEFGPTDVVGQVANPAFDAITFEVWGALLNGSRVVILDTDTVLSPKNFASAIEKHGITIMFLTASLFSVMAATIPTAFGRMRTLMAGGDAVNPEAARTILKMGPPQRLVNGYGPTECTTFSVCHWIQSVPEGARSIPIGRPISNSEAFVLNGALEVVQVGEAGDLYLGGDGLARGYLNRPELTAERFIAHPFDSTPGARLYKTGDRARYLPEGTIEFLGRLDHQVKFHGFRIELGEIETALKKHPQVIDAVVMVVKASAHDDRLAAWVSLINPERLSESDLRLFLSDELPKYMVPSHVVVLAALPLNAVGKVDRNLLPDPLSAQRGQEGGALASTQLETRIMEIWKQVLSLSSVGVDENFFDLGGTSLTLALVADRLQALNKPFEITDLFRHPTIRTLARFLGTTEDQSGGALVRAAQERAARQRAAFRARPQSPVVNKI
ncbi:MAG TPA: non-ribosomal peptide synthetase [Bryobacteraceae bacterium]|nr:non-ribosomal peptide synthetase [Bryobacteraceae bacterium]